MTPRPVARYVPLILPQACPARAGGRLRPGGMGALAREARPAWGVLSNAAVQPCCLTEGRKRWI